jgi:hypothetical protein
MIKYSLLDEYVCTKCKEIVEAPQMATIGELTKLSHVDTCMHEWEKVISEERTEE